MIVAVVNTKGGVGKSTLALNFAIARAIAGRDVWMIDCDPRQKSATNAIAIRSEAERSPTITISSFARGELLRAQAKHKQDKFDDIVIDCGGGASELLLATLCLADVAVAPFKPRTFDVWATQDFALLVGQARSMRDGLKVFGVLNEADPSGQDNLSAAEFVAGIDGIEYLDSPVGRRKAIADAAGAGLSVLEHTPTDPKARMEIQRLVDKVFGN